MIGNPENINRIFEQASPVELNEGRLAYWNYQKVCSGLAEFYGYSLPEVISVFAALSPNTDYVSNLRSTATVLAAHKLGLAPERVKVSTYNHCRDRAFTYLSGVSFMDTVKGKKIRSFYQNILDPGDRLPVTIDGHAVNIWRGQRVNLKQVVVEGGFNYEEVAQTYREVAAGLDLLPNQLQSITWFTWKWIHNIYPSRRQLELFRDRGNDLWKTVYSPEDIIPYPFLV